MIFLAGSIIFSSILVLAFKVCEIYKIDIFQAIVFNYATCIITGAIVSGDIPAYENFVNKPWFAWAAAMGLGFVISFNLIALTVKKSGISAAAVASKLSLVIPFIFSVWLYDDDVSFLKISGIVIAIIAVILSSTRFTEKDINYGGAKSIVVMITLPAIVFLFTGLLDTAIKYVEHNFLTAGMQDDYLISSFSFAFAAGLLVLTTLLVARRKTLQGRAVIAGIVIGIPNYFSIWCLMKSLKQYGNFSSVLIPVNNLGIVLLSVLAGWIIFNEKNSILNWIGIGLAVLAIIMISFF
ncbi:MAG: hypothetical protein ABIW38_15515 [Ferruginibacter sp.]